MIIVFSPSVRVAGLAGQATIPFMPSFLLFLVYDVTAVKMARYIASEQGMNSVIKALTHA